MSMPRDYKHIAAWGKMMGSHRYYIDQQQAMAASDNAPIDAVYYNDRDKKWTVIGDCNANTQARVRELLK